MKCKAAILAAETGVDIEQGSSRTVAELIGLRPSAKSSIGDHRRGDCVCYRDNVHKIHKIHEKAKNVRVLTIDVENSPNIVHAWGLYDQRIGINQIVKPATTFGVGYKWYDEDEAHFLSDHEHGHDEMVARTHALLEEADVVVGFNQTRFDLPHLGREFVLAGLNPPMPYRQIDLLKVARKQFKFTSNKLDFLAQQFGLGSKTSHEGHSLWVKCMDNDPEAWAKMAEYCRQDVLLTEKLFDRLRPWLTGVPHLGAIAGVHASCPSCGGTNLKRAGNAHANVAVYKAYRCQDCGSPVRSTTRLQDTTHTRSYAA